MCVCNNSVWTRLRRGKRESRYVEQRVDIVSIGFINSEENDKSGSVFIMTLTGQL